MKTALPIALLLALTLQACGDDDSQPPAAAVDASAPSDTPPSPDTPPHDAPEGGDAGGTGPPLTYAVPLQPGAPWPKFRRDAAQTGHSPIGLTHDGGALWTVTTGKGIFSSPVIGADGTVYIGSADWTFYALTADGAERWTLTTGEIIDSAALLDDQGRVYVGSGDGHLYARDAADGAEIWTFAAEDPADTGGFINWFEGNVAMGPDGTLYVPNDNFRLYAVDRDTGQMKWSATLPDQTWSLPAVDVATGHLYVGNNNVLLANTFAFDASGQALWSQGSIATISASPTLTGQGTLALGGFDGFVRAHALEDGSAQWSFGARDHVYASAALHPAGFVVVPAADGTIYALDVATGGVQWAFDWGAPIRSSPAIDGEGRVVVGTGDGHLLVLEADGTLRWAMRLVEGDRDDLNASPALGRHQIVIAGESGEIFGVPWDYCLHQDETDPRCVLGPDEPLPSNGALLLYTTHFGTTLAEPPEAIDANQALAFTLSVREGGDTTLSLIDDASLEVTVTPETAVSTTVSGGRRFVSLVPAAGFEPDAAGQVTVTLKGQYLQDPDRSGLAMTGGTAAGAFDQTFTFTLNPATGGQALALPMYGASATGAVAFGPTTTWELRRLAAPLPTLLPSYNQIGFDSLHFLVSVVDGDATSGVAWLVEGRPDPATGTTRVAPGTRGMFPFSYRYQGGLLTLVNEDGLELEIMSFVLGFDSFRVATRLDDKGVATRAADVQAGATCGDIAFYGPFLQQLGMCNPASDQLLAYGATLLEPWPHGADGPPEGLGEVSIAVEGSSVVATLSGSTIELASHSVALFLVHEATNKPLALPYGTTLEREADADGHLQKVTLPLGDAALPSPVRAYLMIDTTPAARAIGLKLAPGE